jgi:hypothetical protein
MKLRTLLIDNTNYLWQPTNRTGEYGWYEMDHDLSVRAKALDKSARPTIAIYNEDGGPTIELNSNQYDYLEIATRYAQFADGGEMGDGSVEQFWAYAKAYEVLGGDHAFGGTEDGIYCHVGDANLFCDYTDGVYNLFDQGIHGYAVTADALKAAYNAVVSELELWDNFRQKREMEAAEN